ncbi:MAG: DUF1684 domain-containing protein [Bacteroidia bacterium]|nr:DUF1684 domain-containing protein [Bacteroidia bacterium]
MRTVIIAFSHIILLVLLTSCNNQNNSKYLQTIAAHRMQLNEIFFDPAQSPLDSNAFTHFKGIKFFPVDEDYNVTAIIEPINNAPVFELPHSHNATKPYKHYGRIKFELKGRSYTLIILEAANKKVGYENYLLVPFLDETNGANTYGGGRYIDILKPVGNTLELDFNLAYSPYCAYNSSFTCPVPPKENLLPVKIEAGMKHDAAMFDN